MGLPSVPQLWVPISQAGPMLSELGPPSFTTEPRGRSKSNWKVFASVPPPPPAPTVLATSGQLSKRFTHKSPSWSLLKIVGEGSQALGKPSPSVSAPERALDARGSQPTFGTLAHVSSAFSTPS